MYMHNDIQCYTVRLYAQMYAPLLIQLVLTNKRIVIVNADIRGPFIQRPRVISLQFNKAIIWTTPELGWS